MPPPYLPFPSAVVSRPTPPTYNLSLRLNNSHPLNFSSPASHKRSQERLRSPRRYKNQWKRTMRTRRQRQVETSNVSLAYLSVGATTDLPPNLSGISCSDSYNNAAAAYTGGGGGVVATPARLAPLCCRPPLPSPPTIPTPDPAPPLPCHLIIDPPPPFSNFFILIQLVVALPPLLPLLLIIIVRWV